ncbi:hypothetical protein N9980_01990, partial [bacterium]|nr:hypothetical protein [bacterium]
MVFRFFKWLCHFFLLSPSSNVSRSILLRFKLERIRTTVEGFDDLVDLICHSLFEVHENIPDL